MIHNLNRTPTKGKGRRKTWMLSIRQGLRRISPGRQLRIRDRKSTRIEKTGPLCLRRTVHTRKLTTFRGIGACRVKTLILMTMSLLGAWPEKKRIQRINIPRGPSSILHSSRLTRVSRGLDHGMYYNTLCPLAIEIYYSWMKNSNAHPHLFPFIP